MGEEFGRSEDQQGGDSESDDPEVPTREVAADPDAHAHDPEEHTQNTERKIAVAEWATRTGFPWIGRKVNWVWSNVLARSNFWMAAATMAIAVATWIYTYYAGKQWTAMNQTLSEIQKQTPEIQKQATAAQAQLSQAESEWKVQQRPWVGLSGNVVLKPPSFFVFKANRESRTQFNADVTFALKNVGPSPAFHASWELWTLQTDNASVLLPQRQMNLACSLADSETKESGTVIFPNGPDNVANVSEEGGDQIEWTEIRRIWIVGCISYTTAVDTVIHHTRFWTVSYLIPKGTSRSVVKDDQEGTEFTLPINGWLMIKTEAD